MTETSTRRGRAISLTLKVEFALFFVIVPVAGAVLLPANAMFGLLFAMTALALLLLQITPGFSWHELTRGWGRIDIPRVAALALLTAVAAWAVLDATRPEAMFFLPRARPQLMLAIALLYPLLSALPQEIVFRPLFFRRYGALFPDARGALVVNAAVFSLAHLMYWSWIVAAMTFLGGLAFAEAYARRGSFATAVVQHAVAGIILFTCANLETGFRKVDRQHADRRRHQCALRSVPMKPSWHTRCHWVGASTASVQSAWLVAGPNNSIAGRVRGAIGAVVITAPTPALSACGASVALCSGHSAGTASPFAGCSCPRLKTRS